MIVTGCTAQTIEVSGYNGALGIHGGDDCGRFGEYADP